MKENPDLSSQIPDPIPRLYPAQGRGLGECLDSKMGSIFQLLPRGTERSWDSLPALPALPEPSPKVLLKPSLSRACPQDDVSSTSQTPSN